MFVSLSFLGRLLSDYNEIWHIGRGMIYDDMQYDPIQGKGHGHEPLKVGNLSIFKSYLLRYLQWELATDD